MLLSFRVSNHKSIRDEQTLHMQPVYDKSRPAVPVAAIFGANAAGKSNVLDALSFMVEAVRDSFSSWRDEVPRGPFRLDDTSPSTHSLFEVELLLDGVRWVYGFAVDDQAVREEWLHSYPQHRRRVVFERRDSKVTAGSATNLDRGLLKNLSALLYRPSLLLSMAPVEVFAELAPVRHWFSTVGIVPSNGAATDEQAIVHRLQSAPDRNRLVALLVAADVGIVGVDVEHLVPRSWLLERAYRLRPADTLREVDVAQGSGDDDEAEDLRAWLIKQLSRIEQTAPEKPQARLVFLHGKDRIKMSFDDESHGTKVWLGYLGPVLDTLDSGGLLVIDEFDTSLHPHLTAQLVSLFRDPQANQRGAQLVFTSHDATLLGKSFGDDILGRDEVWFVEKNAAQATELFSLADFKARKEDNVERRYLTGSYGAIPEPGERIFRDAVRGRSA